MNDTDEVRPVKLSRETVRRPCDTAECDYCGADIRIGCVLLWSALDGTGYCSMHCAQADAQQVGRGEAIITRDIGD